MVVQILENMITSLTGEVQALSTANDNAFVPLLDAFAQIRLTLGIIHYLLGRQHENVCDIVLSDAILVNTVEEPKSLCVWHPWSVFEIHVEKVERDLLLEHEGFEINAFPALDDVAENLAEGSALIFAVKLPVEDDRFFWNAQILVAENEMHIITNVTQGWNEEAVPGKERIDHSCASNPIDLRGHIQR